MGMLEEAYAVLTDEALTGAIDDHLFYAKRAVSKAERLWHLAAMEIALSELDRRITVTVEAA